MHRVSHNPCTVSVSCPSHRRHLHNRPTITPTTPQNRQNEHVHGARVYANGGYMVLGARVYLGVVHVRVLGVVHVRVLGVVHVRVLGHVPGHWSSDPCHWSSDPVTGRRSRVSLTGTRVSLTGPCSWSSTGPCSWSSTGLVIMSEWVMEPRISILGFIVLLRFYGNALELSSLDRAKSKVKLSHSVDCVNNLVMTSDVSLRVGVTLI